MDKCNYCERDAIGTVSIGGSCDDSWRYCLEHELQARMDRDRELVRVIGRPFEEVSGYEPFKAMAEANDSTDLYIGIAAEDIHIGEHVCIGKSGALYRHHSSVPILKDAVKKWEADVKREDSVAKIDTLL